MKISINIATWMLQKQLKDETGQGPKVTVFNEWRLFAFVDAGTALVLNPLPEQQSQFDLWSYGVGSRFKMFNYINGALFVSEPKISQATTLANHPRVNFRFWGEF